MNAFNGRTTINLSVTPHALISLLADTLFHAFSDFNDRSENAYKNFKKQLIKLSKYDNLL